MIVNTNLKNEALVSLLDDKEQIIPLDANILIPSNRTKILSHAYFEFEYYKSCFLEPLFKAFSSLALHEAIYEELKPKPELISFIDDKISNEELILLNNKDLSDIELIIYQSVEQKVAYHTGYEPGLDNKDDRGEVKSLSYIQVRELIYFCTNDFNALKLVEEAEKLETNLEDVKTIKMYEILYLLYSEGFGNKEDMRRLYKQCYYLSKKEKKENPEWQEFVQSMNALYKS